MIENDIEPYLTWDTFQIIQRQADYLFECGYFKDETQAFVSASQDADLLEFEWENLLEVLTDKLQELNPGGYWVGEVKQFGWRKENGVKQFNADDGKIFLQEILPQTECSFRLFCLKDQILIQNFHHDSPTGDEWYIIKRDNTASSEAA